MRIATWNVNSLKARMPRVEEWIAQAEPDVLCLQETKLPDDAFPHLAFASLGYESVHNGEGRWNGVAIVSRVGLTDPERGFGPGVVDPYEGDARLLAATCGGVRITTVYVPNGREVPSEFYDRKLVWLDRLVEWVAAHHEPSDPLVICGDWNIAPEDRDVWDPAATSGGTHVTEAERDRLGALRSWGLVDTFRQVHEDGGVFSWWDYRAGNFHKGMGMRIDYLYATAPVAERVQWALIDRNARKGSQPSDHAPVFIDID